MYVAMQTATDGLVLKEQAVGENDRLITILTRTDGLVRAFARGARNLKSRNASATQTLSYSDFVIFRGRESNMIDSAEIKKVFFGLRSDLIKLTLAQYFGELAISLAPEGDDASAYLRLLLNALHFLEAGTRPPRILKAAVEMRMMAFSGYMPDLVGCAGCGEYESGTMFFRLRDGVIVCEKCYRADGTPTVSLEPGVLAALRHTIYAPFEKVFSFKLSPNGEKQLETAAELYVRAQLERDFKTLEFYRRISLEE